MLYSVEILRHAILPVLRISIGGSHSEARRIGSFPPRSNIAYSCLGVFLDAGAEIVASSAGPMIATPSNVPRFREGKYVRSEHSWIFHTGKDEPDGTY